MAFLTIRGTAGSAWRNHQIRRIATAHATAGLDASPDLVVHEHIGPEVRHFDALTDEQDNITYQDALSTRVEELREEHRGLSKQIAYQPSAIMSIGLLTLLAFADFQANIFFFANSGIPADQRPFIAGGLTALNIVIAAVGSALVTKGGNE